MCCLSLISIIHNWAFFLAMNVMAHIMTRWMRGYPRSNKIQHHVARLTGSAHHHMGLTVLKDLSDWPSTAYILSVHQSASPSCQHPRGSPTVYYGPKLKFGFCRFPKTKIKLLTGAHAGQAGHCGVQATAATLREQLWWSWLQGDANDFDFDCLLCGRSRNCWQVP